MNYLLQNFRRAKKRVIFIMFLLLLNAFVTFSGFVAYTKEERLACNLIVHVDNSGITNERKNEIHNKLNKDDKKLFDKYFVSYQKKGFCMTFEKFIINELLIIFFGFLLILIRRKK